MALIGLVVRTTADPTALAQAVRNQIPKYSEEHQRNAFYNQLELNQTNLLGGGANAMGEP
jgi:hypothetical protein